MFVEPEALFSDKGTNLLSHLMLDCWRLLGTKKRNTTAYHPEYDGMVKRFNRTLNTMLRKHVDQFGVKWDRYLHRLLWAYRNTAHESVGKKPSSCCLVLIVAHPQRLHYCLQLRLSRLKCKTIKRSLFYHCHMRKP